MFTVIFDLKEWITSFAGRRGPGWTKRGRDAVLMDEERLGVEGGAQPDYDLCWRWRCRRRAGYRMAGGMTGHEVQSGWIRRIAWNRDDSRQRVTVKSVRWRSVRHARGRKSGSMISVGSKSIDIKEGAGVPLPQVRTLTYLSPAPALSLQPAGLSPFHTLPTFPFTARTSLRTYGREHSNSADFGHRAVPPQARLVVGTPL